MLRARYNHPPITWEADASIGAPLVTNAPISRVDRVVLSRELADFILALSGAFQKFTMYPEGHPALEGAVRNFVRKLEVVFLERNAITVGVTPSQLIISGIPTDPKQVLLRDLAANLHKRNIGGIKISVGVARSEIEHAMHAMTHQEFSTGEDPHEENPALPFWPHLRLYPLTYDHLELLEDEEDENKPVGVGGMGEDSWAKRLWMSLARVALGTEMADEVAAAMLPIELARAIEKRLDDDEYDVRVLASLTDLTEAARSRGRADVAGIQEQLSELVGALSPETTRRLVSLRGDGLQQRSFLVAASYVMTADVVRQLVEAAAESSGKDLSPALLALLQKLALHAVQSTNGRKAVADDSFRELVRRLIEGWEEQQATQNLPELYGADVTRLPELPDITSSVWVYPPEPERILLMSIESGILEAGTLRAVDFMMAKGQTDQLLMMLEDLEDDPVAKVIHDRVFHPRTVSVLLSTDPIDINTLSRLIPDSGLEAADLLLDTLAAAKDRKVRAKLLELLVRYGKAIGPEIVSRIPGAPWYVQRNLLHLLGQLPQLPPEFSPDICLGHPDPRVRHEGLKLLLRDPVARENAIVVAVRAPDPPTLRLGLVAASETLPPDAVEPIMTRLASRKLPDDLRALAVRAVGGVEEEAVFEMLAGLCTGRRRWLWWRLAPKSASMLEALAAVSVHWRYHARASRILKRAGRHRDKQVREAAGAHARMRTDENDPRLRVIV